MAIDFSGTLIVGISATALFNLEEADRVFRERGIGAYRDHMLASEDQRLAPGTAFPLVRALLALRGRSEGESPLVEVVVMSHNSPETAVGILNSVRAYELQITRFAFTGGESLAEYTGAFGIDLFLSTSESDVQCVIDRGICAAALLYPPPEGYEPPSDQVRIAFDADAVLFSEESEIVYKTRGISDFHRTENEASATPLADGPHAKFLKKLSTLQARLPGRVEYSPIRLAVVTARNAPAELRVITTLRHWGIYVDAAFFLGGLPKDPFLKALRPHIYFDDQEAYVAPASRVVPSGRVPYRQASPLFHGTPSSVDAEGGIPLNRSPADVEEVGGGDPMEDDVSLND